ncbi:EF-P lysine aminoacylase GenX [bacterium]|nr:EF-P lysine aminoacylase GenX [bacterium]
MNHARNNGGFNWPVLEKRALILRYIRDFFRSRGYLEVEAPLLTPFPTLDANITSFLTAWHDGRGERSPLFLHTSPEHSMKKMLAAGAGDIVFLGKVFRNEESSPLHNAEFTMLEWYRRNADYRDIMEETEALIMFIARKLAEGDSITYQGLHIDLSPPWKRITVRDLFLQYVGIDLFEKHSRQDMINAVNAHKLHHQSDDSWETLFFRLYLSKIEPFIGLTKPLFITDYPLSMGMMAKAGAERPEWAERAELYIGGMELANGYSELLDSGEQQRRFENDRRIKKKQTGRTLPIDTELLAALCRDLPPCAGMALGVDRLVMLFTGCASVDEVMLFPLSRYAGRRSE